MSSSLSNVSALVTSELTLCTVGGGGHENIHKIFIRRGQDREIRTYLLCKPDDTGHRLSLENSDGAFTHRDEVDCRRWSDEMK